jgi:hypothetical protein
MLVQIMVGHDFKTLIMCWNTIFKRHRTSVDIGPAQFGCLLSRKAKVETVGVREQPSEVIRSIYRLLPSSVVDVL